MGGRWGVNCSTYLRCSSPGHAPACGTPFHPRQALVFLLPIIIWRGGRGSNKQGYQASRQHDPNYHSPRWPSAVAGLEDFKMLDLKT